MHAIIPIALGAAATGALESYRSGSLRRVIGQTPTEGATRALAALRPVAGVAVPEVSSGSSLDVFKAQQQALVKARGAVTSGIAYEYPRMRIADLRALVESWFDAFEAGRDASASTARDFALVKESVGTTGATGWALSLVASVKEWDNARAGREPEYADHHTDLARYLFALTSWCERELSMGRGADADSIWDDIADGAADVREATAAQVVGTFDRLRWFIGGIEGVSYVFPWARPSEQDHVPGAVGAAAGAALSFPFEVAGDIVDVAGQLVRAVLERPLLYIGAALLVGGGVYLAVTHAR